MKYFDWSIALCVLGADALVLGVILNWPLLPLALGTAVLFVLIALRTRTQRNQLRKLQEHCTSLSEQLEQARNQHEQAMTDLKTENEHARSTFFSEISQRAPWIRCASPSIWIASFTIPAA